MKTDIQDFLPDDELVKANMRIYDYFGTQQQIMMLYAVKQNANSTITPQALKEQYFIQKEIEKNPEVEGSVSIATLLDQICQIEFGTTLENSTNKQIITALNDLLTERENTDIRILKKDDPNEAIDYKPFPRLSKGKTIDCMDIKNYYVTSDNTTITFSIEVYDLSQLKKTLKPPYFMLNVIEWYIDFKNLIIPDKRLDINFRIAAHLEPTNSLWEIGKGVAKNIKDIIKNMRKHELFNSYKKETYLWVKPPGQNMYFPVPLKTANVTFNIEDNRIVINISREEIGRLGVAPKMGAFEIPAKLGYFNAGVRYYQLPWLKIPWARLTINTSFITKSIGKIRSRPIINNIATRILQKYGGISWEKYDELFELMNQTGYLPDKIALKDIDRCWKTSDKAPDEGFAANTFFIKPYYMKELRINALAFLSKDYEEKHTPKASLIILQINGTLEYEESMKINKKIAQNVFELDRQNDFVRIEVTGEGVISYQINDMTSKANQIIGPMIFIIIMLILLITFRKISYVLLPLLSLTVSIIWLFGTMVLLGIPFNTMAVALVPLLMGLGVDYSVHLFHNYKVETEKGKTAAHAIKKSVKEIGTAMFLAMITTVIAFMSFLTATVPPVRNFGILVGIGIIYTFITAITLQASIRYILDRKKKFRKKIRKKRLSLRKIMYRTANAVMTHQKTIILVGTAVSIIMLMGASNLETGFDLEEFLPQNNPAINLFNKISDEFPYASEQQEYILIEGEVATVETLRGISETHKNMEDDTLIARKPDGTTKTISIMTIIKDAVKNNNSLITVFNIDQTTGIPKTDYDVKRLYDYLYEDKMYSISTKNVLHRENNRYTATVMRIYVDMSIQKRDSADINKMRETLKQELNTDISDYGNAVACATGPNIITLTITASLTESQITSTAISIIFAGIALIIAYRRPTRTYHNDTCIHLNHLDTWNNILHRILSKHYDHNGNQSNHRNRNRLRNTHHRKI